MGSPVDAARTARGDRAPDAGALRGGRATPDRRPAASPLAVSAGRAVAWGGAEVIRIRRALLSAYEKDGLVELAETLVAAGVEIVSTGGTARTLKAAGVAVVPIEQVTRWPEMLAGRLKTLTPQIHGGLLMRRGEATDRAEAEAHGIAPIDLLCVNLYPFRETVAREGARREECIEMIDIGGPAMIRAAAKNHRDVVVITSPRQYAGIISELRNGAGTITRETAARLAIEAFAATAAYDASILHYLWSTTPIDPDAGRVRDWPLHWAIGGLRGTALRYGENPNQSASMYVGASGFWTAMQQHQGKALSYNNLSDLWAAWKLICEFDACACAVIKHAMPCGVAVGARPLEAFQRARLGDPLSAFGGVVILNRPVGEEVAGALGEIFLEVVAAPRWDADALARLEKKRNLRLLTIPDPVAQARCPETLQAKSLGEALLLQAAMPASAPASGWEQVAGAPVAAELLAGLDFAWRVVRHLRSNAIALTRGGQTIGLGGGQTSRIDALEIALHKAARSEHAAAGAVLASDAFFPFRDVVDRAAEAGIAAIVQPGGSRRDKESIDACNEHDLPMFFTGERVFAH
ncbi:MAG: bifunctional phosphoribosylaminoimidazolecarboxamide formyltransferase/IMP cyclohydrolase [Candidatus Eisenbacteria bacterium]|nr:bifunctional phosphoribosylaminoimidazolecarboxamide formyltransferase/IMP cyclohydrolase [Candidatus Eisenbacteria bacterium]